MRLGLLIGFGGMTCAWAGPLYQCPGMLFSNNLDPVQARAMGCEPMQPGRLSQAHNTPTAQSETRETDAPAADTVRPSSAPVALGTRQLAEPGPEVAKQRQRDSHAREIIQAELARTQAQMQSLSAQPPGADAQNALQRLRIDEAALLRELARRPG